MEIKMEKLAAKIRKEAEDACIGFFIFKQTDMIEKILPLTGEVQTFLGSFLQGNVFGMEEEDYKVLSGYAAGVAADYVEAVEQRDAVLMADTLEFGLKGLLDIYMELAEEEV